MPPRSPSGDRMQWPEPANTEQRKAPARPTKGGAVRTRIALVAIASIAITTTTVLQAATVQPARGAPAPHTGITTTTITHRPGHPPTGAPPGAVKAAPSGSSLMLDLNAALLAHAAAGASPAPPPPAPPAPPAPAGPVDTVTPAQRTAWERVAMCEEGGNWQADSSRFSGGLGITRANWDLFGGRAFAPEGALATEDQQIMVAERIQPNAPDQYRCGSW
jgi:hypothetical protein